MKKATCLSLMGLLLGCGQSTDSSDAQPASQEFDASTSFPGFDAGHGADGGQGSPQSWTGYIENCKLQWDGSDAIRLAFATDTTGQVAGKFKFGNPSLQLPPATDPNIGYPPGYKPGTIADWYEGFDFSLREGKLSPARLQFSLDLWEVWAGWCALQTPPNGGGTCTNWGGSMSGDFTLCTQVNPTTGEAVVVDCGKVDLCTHGNVCDCSGSACRLSPDNYGGRILSVDIAFSVDSANGSMVDFGGTMCDWNGSYAVHLKRDP